MIQATKRFLENPTFLTYRPGAGENQDLRWQVRCHHSTMGEVALCYIHESDAKQAAEFIQSFGHAPPTPMEKERRPELDDALSTLAQVRKESR
ncbi:MAG: hypothetical protein KGL39_53555 [Patescibacteria group bacterium]|nr:hypothetical protein [Patescibacteria group bacterium]